MWVVLGQEGVERVEVRCSLQLLLLLLLLLMLLLFLLLLLLLLMLLFAVGTSAFPLQAVPHFNIDFESYMQQVTLLIPYIDKAADQQNDDDYPDKNICSPQ